MTDTPSDLQVNVLPGYSAADLGDVRFAADAFSVFLGHGELFIADHLGYPDPTTVY